MASINVPASEIVCVSLFKDKRIVLAPYAFPLAGTETFSQILESLYVASIRDTLNTRFNEPITIGDKTLIKCYVSSSSNGEKIEMNTSLKAIDAVKMFGAYVSFELTDKFCEKTNSNQQKSAFDVLMSSKTPIRYPLKFGSNPEECKRGDFRLRNDFIDKILKDNDIGFPDGLENTVGKAIVDRTCNLLYYVLPHLQKMCARCSDFPELFTPLLKNENTFEQDYNVPEKHKNIARIDSKTLDLKLQAMYSIKLNYSTTLNHPRMEKFHAAMTSFINICQTYLDNLLKTNERQKMIHQSLQPVRSVTDGKSSEVRPIKGAVRSVDVVERYKQIEIKLTETCESYEPIFLNDFFTNMDRKQRYYFINDIQFPFDIEVFAYHPGSRQCSLWFCWKSDGTDPHKTNCVIHKIENDDNIPVYHTRAMRKEFFDKFSLITKLSPSVMTALYQFLTNDQSEMPNKISKEVQARLKLLVQTQDPDIVYDLRENNKGRPEKFNEFWNEVDSYLNEQEAKAVDDRRHGTICHLSVAMSVPDLREIIKSRLAVDNAIPSVKWLYLQFMPRNPYLKTAFHYTGRFNLKLKVQTRQYSLFHVDAHYAAAVFRYMKEFCIMFRENTCLMCVDDKANIPVGEPGIPLASVARGKRTVVQENIPLMVADHDTNTKCKITPSTILIPEIPESIEKGSFYRGTVCTILKDCIFQPSTPLRHSAEMRKIVATTGNFTKPIRVIYSDGGPDHRVTYQSVQLALIAQFLIDDLDVLLAGRCCPSKSYTNPAERWHSVMNLALQSVALERSEMNPEFERIMSRCDSMKAIRENAEKVLGFSDAVMESMSQVKQTLQDLFGRLSLKGKQCIVQEAADGDLIDVMWDALLTVDDSISRENTTAKSLTGKFIVGYL